MGDFKRNRKPHLDTLWGAVSQVSEVFSHLVVIWYEVMNHVEYLKGSGQMMFRSLFVWVRKTMTGK